MQEYGRGIYQMVEHALTLEDRAQRQTCATNIINTMRLMHPEVKQQPHGEQKLWEHLAMMSNFQLDVDYPFDVTAAAEAQKRPEPLVYPKTKVPVRHYGRLVFKMIEELTAMDKDGRYDALLRITANQMKRDLIQWGHNSSCEERVADDLARFSNGKVQLPDDFKFERVQVNHLQPKKKKK